MERSRWDGSVRGDWFRDHYIALVDGQIELVRSLAAVCSLSPFELDRY